MIEHAASKCRVPAVAIKVLLETHQRGNQVPRTPPAFPPAVAPAVPPAVPPADAGAPLAVPPAGAPTAVVVDGVVPGQTLLDHLYGQMDPDRWRRDASGGENEWTDDGLIHHRTPFGFRELRS